MKIYLEIFDISTQNGRRLVSEYRDADTMKGEYINPYNLVKNTLADLKEYNIQSKKLWCQMYETMSGNVSVVSGSLEDFEKNGLSCLDRIIFNKEQVDRLQEMLS